MSDVILKIRNGTYAYPQAYQWHELWIMLTEKLPEIEVPRPLILGGAIAIDYDKNQRLIEQIDIASAHGLLNEAQKILESIPEERWVKPIGKMDPNEKPYWLIYEEKNELEEKEWLKIYGPILEATQSKIAYLLEHKFITDLDHLESIFQDVLKDFNGFAYDAEKDESYEIDVADEDWSKYSKFKDELVAIHRAWYKARDLSWHYKGKIVPDFDPDVGEWWEFFEEAMAYPESPWTYHQDD